MITPIPSSPSSPELIARNTLQRLADRIHFWRVSRQGFGEAICLLCDIEDDLRAALAAAPVEPHRPNLELAHLLSHDVMTVMMGRLSTGEYKKRIERALNAGAAALSLELDNHHNATKCPYCTPAAPVDPLKCPDAKPDGTGHDWSNDYGDDWYPEKGRACDCGKRVAGERGQPSTAAPVEPAPTKDTGDDASREAAKRMSVRGPSSTNECPKCGGLPPGEASSAGDLCHCEATPALTPGEPGAQR